MQIPKFTIAVSVVLIGGTVVFLRAPQVVSAAPEPVGSVERLDPALDALIAPASAIERVATGFKFLDASLWRSSGVLWVSDIVGNVLYQWAPDGKVTEVLNPGGYDGHELPEGGYVGPNGMAPGPNHTVTLCQHGNRRIVSVAPDKKLTVLVDRYEGKRLNSPNDVVYGPSGALYFTDPPYGLPKKDDDPAKELKFNGVFRFANGKLQAIVQNLVVPNGLGFSPDYKILYLTSSDATHRQWLRCDVGADGGANNCRVFLDVSASPDKGAPDGMKLDSAGNLYAVGPGGVWVISPEGKHLGTIRIPEAPGSCVWGDDGKTLYVTARTSIYRIRGKVAGEKPFYY
jgi:gluconolactonase